ncbi:hypothetical protein A3K69_01570 [Candidatus Bathyarchaeota archaeon RBG_16_57_9]|nr:MAG: hypothetical protein A3K69_01570 [Candidatus Bathyarchaeota archaeon RBG_16_57_9]
MSGLQSSELVEIFRADERILVAYMFGSRSRGLQTLESDTDVAVLLSTLPEDALDLYLDLVDRLSRVVGGPVDLVFLNAAPLLLRHQVIKHGRVLFSRDEAARVQFETRSVKEYMDFRPRSDEYDEALVEEVSKWKG